MNLIKRINVEKKVVLAMELLFIYFWMTYLLQYADSMIGTDLFIGVAAMVAAWYEYRREQETGFGAEGAFAVVFGILVAISSCLANYSMYWGHTTAKIVGVVGGFFAGLMIFKAVFHYCHDYSVKQGSTFDREQGVDTKAKAHKIFLITFLLIFCVDVLYYFFCNFPGAFTPDSVNQVQQCISNVYNDHHPFWHTILMKISMSIGCRIFGSYIAGYVIYFIGQISFMAICFAFAAMTLYEIGAPIAVVAGYTVFSTIMPYHISYSSTMWKDVMYGGSVLLFAIALYRLLVSIDEDSKGGRAVNRLFFFVGAFGSSIFRNNGWYAVAVLCVVFFLVYRRQYLKILVGLLCIMALTFVLKGPVERAMGVAPSDTKAALSIPLQQIAYVVSYNDDLTWDEIENLNHFLPKDEMKDTYNPYISNPIKNLVHDDYMSENMSGFLKLWLQIGMRHPADYVKAWIRQTRGYWNSGYSYWRLASNSANSSGAEDYGIVKTTQTNIIAKYFSAYIHFSDNSIFFQPLLGMGVFTWICILFMMINILLKNKNLVVTALTVLLPIATLLIATPVYSEFRYAYCLFTTVPVYLLLTVYDNKKSDSLL